MTSSAIGRGFDREVVNFLTNRGWLALKSAGSKTIIDVVAFPASKPGSILIIQNKAGAGRVTLREWNGLYSLAEQSLGCVLALVAVRQDTKPIFYEILGPMKPRTRTENLPWRLWTP